ncbi:MAG: hypothetical protein AUK47_03765 [Deltaproteobacteria bacterium CG2_30_63_29]|nr:MAG: hypothetical protein AUK47_03765 [Deltaproteobacteria bacterium CG2_30_63_29]PIW01819.1 MAG: hypothetical protein COW42_03660 [Deltaproteobacteria bacterium CG17_big_fil_post_rev_8_21_14_2_50_63_7]PJB49376.1 MAG: hypothetical protein CO108_00025 [Deltaproteobacteria bacterium CG_4_9_14_3_um_filter_63_12]
MDALRHEARKTPFARVLLLVALLAAAITAFALLPVNHWTAAFLEWTESLGAWGLVLVAVVYVPACLFAFPGSVLTLGTGFAFGVVPGTIAVSIGSTAGAAAAFLVGRRFAREAIEQKLDKYPRFRAIEGAIEQQGFKIVLLTRLSPVFPFNLLNYAYGLTKVSFKDYVLASWLGMLPGTLMFVYLGSAAGDLTQLLTTGKLDGGAAQQALFWGGLLATIVVTVFVTRVARKALREAEQAAAVGLGSEDVA